MAECPDCSRTIEDEFRFCPSCGRRLRTKVVEYFRGDPRFADGDLRVSVYLNEPQNVRLSFWRDDHAEAALSLDPAEAARLAGFLSGFVRPPRRSLVSSVRTTARQARQRLAASSRH